MVGLKRHLRNAIIVVIAIVGFKYTQDIQDWAKLFRYQPPQAIARLAAVTTMTDTGRRLFYVNTPQIEARKSALNLCKNTEHTVVLGCYVTGKGIFLQSVPDPRLEGVMEVTAAHEMLHVAYDRLSLLQQNQLNQKLQSAFGQLKNQRIRNLIGVYNTQDPRSVNTELHSILATEVRDLSGELEEHYRIYFKDRSAIVALSEQYEGVFTSIRDKAKTLTQQLASRKLMMEQLGQQVDTEAANIQSERNSLQSSIATNPQADNNILVARFNDRVENYNRLVGELRQQNDNYNQMVNEHNTLALEEKSLVESLQNKSSAPTER
jgi:hypothetical protein